MGEKKGKALALELMDDLLKDADAAPIVDVQEAMASQDSEIDKTVELDKAEVRAPAQDATVPLTQEELSADLPAPPVARDQRATRTSVGRPATLRKSGTPSVTEVALAQSESLRLADDRIHKLERELTDLRSSNSKLADSCKTLQDRLDELRADNAKLKVKHDEALTTFKEERELLLTSKEQLQSELEIAKRRYDDYEQNISSNIQKIRVRERELENRLELAKMESAALLRSKDEIILNLKRQIDQINLELTNYRNKNQELNRQINDKHEMLRRTVKALRLALSMLEGEEEVPQAPLKKAK